jgi:hypothetical protein
MSPDIAGQVRSLLFAQGSDRVGEWSVQHQRHVSQVDEGFGSAIEASAAGAVRNGDRRCNRLGDPGGQGRTTPETRRRSSEARMCHGEMMADHVEHSVERLI